jgi:hypothetical protein
MLCSSDVIRGIHLLPRPRLDLDPMCEPQVAHPDVLDVVITDLLQLVFIWTGKAQVRAIADELALLVLDAAPAGRLVPCTGGRGFRVWPGNRQALRRDRTPGPRAGFKNSFELEVWESIIIH